MKAVLPYLCLGVLSCLIHASERPNVLFIAIDDLVPTLGAYGDALAQSPEIDSLAAQGTTFLNHHVQWPVCGPSRAALTTSLMPEETGVMGFKAIRHPDFLPDVVTLPQHFKNNGYETACSGKFHDNRTVGDTTQPFDYTKGQYPDGNSVDDPASWSIAWAGGGSGFNPSGKPAVDYTDQADSAYVDWSILNNGLGLIDTLAAGDKPFFLAVGFKKPHLGFYAPKQYWDLYDTNANGDYTDDVPLASFANDPAGASSYVVNMLDFNSELLGYAPFDSTGLPSDSESRELIHGYYACVSFIDNLVGQLLDKLAATDDPLQAGKKMDETTVVVLWGDHGFHLGDHNRWAKHSNLERSSSAPLIIYDPRSPGAGATTESPVNSIDLYPTLCELAGLPIPEQPQSNTITSGRPLRGRSLVPVLDDPTVSVNGGAITQMSNSGAYGYAYRDKGFRLIEWINGGGNVLARDLFDYGVDGEERVSYAGDAVYEAIVHQMSVSMRTEPATQGMTRLQSSAAYPLPSNMTLPGLSISPDGGILELSWPDAAGVTHRLVSNSDLGAVWNEYAASLQGGSMEITPGPTQEFFLVELDDNTPPHFAVDPLTADLAFDGETYSESISGTASDADPGASLSYSKVSGPSWLMVGLDGSLTGMPATSDIGANYFVVAVTDEEGASQNATLQISVAEASQAATTLSFAPTADVFIKESAASSNFGGNKWLELSENGNGTKRYSYLRFNIIGLPQGAKITKVELFITPNTEGGTAYPEYGNVDIYDVADDTWDQATVTWDNTSGTLRPAVEAPNTAIATLTNSTGSSNDEQSVDLTSANLLSGNGLLSIGMRTQDTSLGRFSSGDHPSEPAPRLEVSYTE